MKESKESIMTQIFRSEITWIIFIIGTLWGFVASVVMPIQSLQINIAKIQEKLNEESVRYANFEERLVIVEKNQAVVMSTLSLKKQ